MWQFYEFYYNTPVNESAFADARAEMMRREKLRARTLYFDLHELMSLI